MFSDPGHPQEQDNARHSPPSRRLTTPLESLAHECLVATAVLLGTLAMGWLFRLVPFG